MTRRSVVLWLWLVLCTSCGVTKNPQFQPSVTQPVMQVNVRDLSSPFPPLSVEEKATSWGQELLIGQQFATDLDLYRAITSFKRSLVLLDDNRSREEQLHYSIILAYWMGGKWQQTIEHFEGSPLRAIRSSFSGYRTLLIVLHDAYQRVGEPERGEKILQITEKHSSPLARQMRLSEALRTGDFALVKELADQPLVSGVERYEANRKSVRKAQLMQAALPGSGYWYVGQRQSAITSFLINAAFIAATVHFFREGNVGAGAITASLETGWYFGGIDGAGRAANQWNEHRWDEWATRTMREERLFPILMLTKSF